MAPRFTAKDLRCRSGANEALLVACNNGHLAVAQYLTDALGLTSDDARTEPYGPRDNYTLRRAYAGHLAVVEWLVERFDFTVHDVLCGESSQKISPMYYACINGHHGVAQWLLEKFGLMPDDVRGGMNSPQHFYDIFGETCARGHLDTAKWFAKTFSFTASDAHFGGGNALRLTRRGGYPEVMRWFVDTFGERCCTCARLFY